MCVCLCAWGACLALCCAANFLLYKQSCCSWDSALVLFSGGQRWCQGSESQVQQQIQHLGYQQPGQRLAEISSTWVWESHSSSGRERADTETLTHDFSSSGWPRPGEAPENWADGGFDPSQTGFVPSTACLCWTQSPHSANRCYQSQADGGAATEHDAEASEAPGPPGTPGTPTRSWKPSSCSTSHLYPSSTQTAASTEECGGSDPTEEASARWRTDACET